MGLTLPIASLKQLDLDEKLTQIAAERSNEVKTHLSYSSINSTGEEQLLQVDSSPTSSLDPINTIDFIPREPLVRINTPLLETYGSIIKKSQEEEKVNLNFNDIFGQESSLSGSGEITGDILANIDKEANISTLDLRNEINPKNTQNKKIENDAINSDASITTEDKPFSLLERPYLRTRKTGINKNKIQTMPAKYEPHVFEQDSFEDYQQKDTKSPTLTNWTHLYLSGSDITLSERMKKKYGVPFEDSIKKEPNDVTGITQRRRADEVSYGDDKTTISSIAQAKTEENQKKQTHNPFFAIGAIAFLGGLCYLAADK